jgi:hypothetical protein
MSNTRWIKGNLHTHTTESDGDTAPEHVAEWYGDHGYGFLVLSDHNHLTVLDDAESHPGKWPLLIPGEEVTSRLFNNTVPVHVNGIGVQSLVEPAYEESARETLNENVERIRAAGGLASINHPNYQWALSTEDIVSASRAWAVEVYNGHTGSNSRGGGGLAGVEEMWDAALSAGNRIFGVATDDSHHFAKEFDPQLANPGRGWVVVRSENETEADVMSAMREGDFYASTGVAIHELKVSRQEMVIEMAPYDSERFTTSFTGSGGRVLAVENGESVRFKPPANEPYVRATVRSSRAASTAWVQPLFLD